MYECILNCQFILKFFHEQTEANAICFCFILFKDRNLLKCTHPTIARERETQFFPSSMCGQYFCVYFLASFHKYVIRFNNNKDFATRRTQKKLFDNEKQMKEK